MLMKSGLLLFLLTVLQVYARYKSVDPDSIVKEISQEPVVVSTSSSRIVSGWVAQPGQHPHHAALRMVNSAGSIGQCGGSIVSKEWVITSASCTVNRILAVVRAGVVSLINPEYIFETTEWYRHPEYNIEISGLQRTNIALMKLQRHVVYTRLVKPIRIQSSADAYRDYDGEQVYASGHGRTETLGPNSDVLRWVYLRAITNRACSGIWSGVFETTICARYFNVTSQNTCFGDNGGPLVHVGLDGVPTLVGVSYFFPSISDGCESGRPSGFIRPGPFLPWFEEVTGIDFENLQEDDGNVDNTTMADTTNPSVTSPTSTNSTTTTPTPTNPTTTNLTSENPTTFPPTFTTTPTSTNTTTNSTLTNPTTITPIPTTPDATTLSSTTSSYPPTSTDSEDFPPEGTTTIQPEDSDSSECNDDDDMAQLLKRLQVDVKVKVRLNKYNITKEVGNDISVWKP